MSELFNYFFKKIKDFAVKTKFENYRSMASFFSKDAGTDIPCVHID